MGQPLKPLVLLLSLLPRMLVFAFLGFFFGLGLGLGLGLSFFAFRYSVLSLVILSFISFPFFISSSVAGNSQGSGILYLLYSSLLLRLMCVSLVRMYDSVSGFCLGFHFGFG